MGRNRSKKKRSNNNANDVKRKVITVMLAIVIVGAVCLSAYTLATKKVVGKWEDKVYPGITIDNIDIGGMSKEEAKAKLEEHLKSEIANKSLHIKVKDQDFELIYSDINPQYDINDAVEQAFKFGKDQGVLEKYSIIKKGEVQQVPINFTYDEEKLKEFEKTIEDKVNVKPKNAQINISNGNISVESESNGKSINIDELDSKIKEALKSNTNETIQLELETTKAKITAEELSKITGPMGSYSSSYGTSAPGRSTNIELATKSINGTILMPGEVFSFNDVVGDRSVERGYQEAGTYVGNKVEPGIGGGICQVSSALYRAAMRANIRSTERTNHSMVVGYMEPGLDATVAYGYLDYKFKNTYDFPIYIEGITAGKVVTYTIYGDPSALNGKKYDMTNEILEVHPPETKEVLDPNLPEGERVDEGGAMTGYKVNSYQITYENGVEISRELISTDNYAKVDSIVKVGTMKAEKEEATEPLEPPAVGQISEENQTPPEVN